MARWTEKLARAARRVRSTIKNVEPNAGRPVRREQPRTRAVDAGVRVEYVPHLDGDPDPGEVVWTWVPFEDDPTLGKDRPVIIIGRHGDDLSGVALTSKAKVRDDYVEVGTGDWDRRGRTSYAKVDRLLDIDPDDVRREGSILNRRQFDEVVDAVSRLHDVVR
jgi:PemK-like, MazF-like toxin of type II toxin-antitoxin system